MSQTTSDKETGIGLTAEISDDRRSARLYIRSKGEETLVLAADAASVDSLIAALGSTRIQMEDPVKFDLPPGMHPLAAFNPRWQILPDSENRFATFWIRHPGLGWSGYGFPRHEAGAIAKWLRKITAVTTTRDTQSPLATSFGGDDLLISTEGLGFYYYGKGETRIGPNPFEQIEFDSDRAVGIVAGSITERRLEQALRSRLREDKPSITMNLFRPSGALGPFSVKIDLAHLLGLVTDETYKDLVNLKNIRNDFAHQLELDSFDLASIKDRCANFILVDRHVGPVPDRNKFNTDAIKLNPYLGLPDYREKLLDPRFRYTMTAQLISFALGVAADNRNSDAPYI